MYATVKDVFMNEDNPKQYFESLGISFKEYPEQEVIMLNYSQIDSPKTHPIVMQCRSLIVDGCGRTVSKKFDRFFNVGEALEITSEVDFQDATIFNKEDGSLIGIWCNSWDGTWNISTKGMAFAEGTMETPTGEKLSFADLTLKTLGVTFDELQTIMDEYSFHYGYDTVLLELCTRMNKVVTPYETDRAYIIGFTNGVYDLDINKPPCTTRIEFLISKFQNLSKVESFQSKGLSTDQIKHLVEALPGMKEGFVIQDNRTGNRVKLKATTYLVAHRIRGDSGVPTLKDMIELICMNEQDEFLSYFPEWVPMYDEIRAKIQKTSFMLSTEYEKIHSIESQKDYALAVMQNKMLKPHSALLFMARKDSIYGGIRFSHYVNQMQNTKVYENLYSN